MSEHEQRSRTGRNGDLIDAVEDFAAGVGRLGYGLLSLGLDLLPPQTRRHTHNAIHELSTAFASLPRDFAEIAGAEIERWAAADGPTAASAATVDPVRVTRLTPEAVTLGATDDGPTLFESGTEPVEQSTAPGGVGIAHIEYDPPGRDVDGEFVLLVNSSNVPMLLSGWTLSDGGARHVFTFPSFILGPGAEVKVWTKRGVNDEANLYWGSRTAIWNNEGDTSTLTDAAGVTISVFAYEGNR
jgi:hypothetical protein